MDTSTSLFDCCNEGVLSWGVRRYASCAQVAQRLLLGPPLPPTTSIPFVGKLKKRVTPCPRAFVFYRWFSSRWSVPFVLKQSKMSWSPSTVAFTNTVVIASWSGLGCVPFGYRARVSGTGLIAQQIPTRRSAAGGSALSRVLFCFVERNPNKRSAPFQNMTTMLLRGYAIGKFLA